MGFKDKMKNKIKFFISKLFLISIKKFIRSFNEIFKPYSEIENSFKGLAIDQKLLNDCFFVENRISMLNYLPHNSIVAEIGTYKGAFAKEIINKTKPISLHLFDISFSKLDQQNLIGKSKVIKNKGDSSKILKTFKNNFFDWIYIDGGHKYEEVIKDIKVAKDKVKPGGFLVFNDFCHIDPYLGRYGVMRAVLEFINKENWKVSFFAFQPAGLYDIAIQRPLKLKSKKK